ncbi:MAG: prepilin-type N-terminal cleavage/methylation domain-containing protein [Verrucomicrobiota bacterium]|nr:prepilin-type N-terminal cleavage/methylation domain-containing protein [Verrucomicrobiota bacterium]
MPDSRPGAGPTSGFSLVELLTVIAIIGIVSVIAVGALVNNQASRVSSSANTVMYMLEGCRQHAITYNTPVRFGIAMDTNDGVKPLQTLMAWEFRTNGWVLIPNSLKILPAGVYIYNDVPVNASASFTNLLTIANNYGSTGVMNFKRVGVSNSIAYLDYDNTGALTMTNLAYDDVSTLSIPIVAASGKLSGASNMYSPAVYSQLKSNSANIVEISVLTGKSRLVK